MRTPREIYAEFTIMLNLQLHQLRVAAVAQYICKHLNTPINEQTVVLECLFHDMGNIIKFDLGKFPEFLEPEGRDYWESVKADFVKKYGNEQHAANAAVALEIGLPAQVIAMMNESGFSKTVGIANTGSFELQVCQYADMRVAPHGVVSLKERMQDFAERYAGKKDAIQEEVLTASADLEEKIFSQSTIQPGAITSESVEPLIKELWEYPVS